LGFGLVQAGAENKTGEKTKKGGISEPQSEIGRNRGKKTHAAVQEFFDSYLERILLYTAVMPKRAWVENEESRKWLDQLSSCCSNQNFFHVSNELHENLVWTFSCSKTNLDHNKFPTEPCPSLSLLNLERNEEHQKKSSYWKLLR